MKDYWRAMGGCQNYKETFFFFPAQKKVESISAEFLLGREKNVFLGNFDAPHLPCFFSFLKRSNTLN